MLDNNINAVEPIGVPAGKSIGIMMNHDDNKSKGYSKESPMKLYTSIESQVKAYPHLDNRGIWVIVFFDSMAGSSNYGWR